MLSSENYLDAQSKFMLIDGMRVHYKREGQGPTVVLLHGSGSSLHCFDNVVLGLADEYELIRLDLPGFGFTGPQPSRDYRIASYVKFLDKFVTALSVERFSLCGNSMGGNIAWNYALAFPEKLKNLVLMNATGYPEKSLPKVMELAKTSVGRALIKDNFSRDAIARDLQKLVGTRTPILDSALVDRVFTLSNLPGNVEAFIDFAATEQSDTSHKIPSIKVNTLVMQGDKVDCQHFARDISASRSLVFEGVGHLLPDEVPEEIVAALQFQFARLR